MVKTSPGPTCCTNFSYIARTNPGQGPGGNPVWLRPLQAARSFRRAPGSHSIGRRCYRWEYTAGVRSAQPGRRLGRATDRCASSGAALMARSERTLRTILPRHCRLQAIRMTASLTKQPLPLRKRIRTRLLCVLLFESLSHHWAHPTAKQ
jgi:hypothetical protein